MQSILMKVFPKRNRNIDRDRRSDLRDEIKKYRKEKTWAPALEDLQDLITISQVSWAKFYSVLGGGMVSNFKRKSPGAQRCFYVTILFLALAILGVYSFVLYTYDGKSKMGLITSVGVICMDFFLYVLA